MSMFEWLLDIIYLMQNKHRMNWQINQQIILLPWKDLSYSTWNCSLLLYNFDHWLYVQSLQMHKASGMIFIKVWLVDNRNKVDAGDVADISY